MTNLPTNRISPKPLPATVEHQRRLDVLRMDLDEHGFRKYSFAHADLAPRDSEKIILQDRKANLDHWLRPASERAIDAEIAALFATMAYRGGNESDLALVQRVYKTDLAGLPSFALSQACGRFRRGEIGDGKFVPKQGEIRQDALRQAQPYFDERAKLNAVLTATIRYRAPTAEERRASVERVERELMPVLAHAQPPNEKARGYAGPAMPRRTSDMTQDERRAVAERRLDELAARAGVVPRLSSEALAIFNNRDVAAE